MFDFQKLGVYRKAKFFNQRVINLLKKSKVDPISENQLVRASLSIVLNIAEGSGRMSKADRRKFFVISRSSLFECIALLEMMSEQYQEFQNGYEDLLSTGDEISRMLYTMIANISNERPFGKE